MKSLYNRKVFFVFLVIFAVACGFFCLKEKSKSLNQCSGIQSIVPVLVLGSGPAGLSAAMYTSRAKLKTIVLAGPINGGQLMDVREIENWPGKEKMTGVDAIEKLRDQAECFGSEIVYDSAKDVDFSVWPFCVKTDQGLTLRPLSIIIATGRFAKRIEVPGVETYWGKGIGTCTICDAPFHKGDAVAVVGGGDTAGDRAQHLAAYAKKVYMFVRDDVLDATGAVQDYINERKNIEVLYNTELKEVFGDGSEIKKVALVNNKTNKEHELALDGMYFAIGYHPNSDVFKNKITRDDNGFISLISGSNQTSVSGVFAGGDVVDKRYGKSGVATGSGIKAALDAINFLQDVGFAMGSDNGLSSQMFVCRAKEKPLVQLKTMAELNNAVEQNPFTIVDVYATYCPSCKNLMPVVRELANSYDGTVAIFKVDQDVSPDIVKKYNVKAVPHFLIFKNGKLVEQTSKLRNKKALEDIIKKYSAI